jgi:RNA polymerase sigma-70 factor, ECF subfamily
VRGVAGEARGQGIPSDDGTEAANGASEERLVARLQAGEDDAYRELLRTYGGRLLALARRLMRNDEDARDCLQEAFLSAFRAIDRFEGKAKLGTWLHRIVVNACLMRLRSQKRRPEELVDPQLPEFDNYGFRIGPTEMAPVSADELMERSEVREHVRRAIDCLPETYRTVLILRDIEQLDTAEAAETLGITPGAVKVRLHRARLALREQVRSAFE